MGIKKTLKSLPYVLKLPFALPALVVFLLCQRHSRFIADLVRWRMIVDNRNCVSFSSKIHVFYVYFIKYPEFRSVFYYRFKIAKAFAFLLPPMPTLYIETADIGPGLFIQHGFSTIIAAHKIGENCWINQQVTIGYANKVDAPTIGDNVAVKAGAKVIGGITLGNNSVVGANAVVVKDVPENCTVGGVPAIILRRNGIRVHEQRVALSADE